MSDENFERELRVRKIRNGTVIDHITNGMALKVLKILGICGKEDNIVSIVMHVPSEKIGRKDIVKIEGKELDPQEVDKIALISPSATINIVRDYKIIKKEKVKLPEVIEGFPKCVNPNCITNSGEPVSQRFRVEERAPLLIRCEYCGKLMNSDEILRYI
ncbi:MAG: aspartate carbamoyltransferase regulatory subunit [Candidatus Jordarchaeales archaeon]|nr:aspartate carbamoyltransferase regulatory subunit [Candidatus Jordarchaeia archaeon]